MDLQGLEALLSSPNYAPELENAGLTAAELSSPAGEALVTDLSEAIEFANSAGFTLLPNDVLSSPQVAAPGVTYTFVEGTCNALNAIVAGNITAAGVGFFTSPAGTLNATLPTSFVDGVNGTFIATQATCGLTGGTALHPLSRANATLNDFVGTVTGEHAHRVMA